MNTLTDYLIREVLSDAQVRQLANELARSCGTYLDDDDVQGIILSIMKGERDA